MNKKVAERILLTVIGIPLFFSLILYADFMHYLLFFIVITVFNFFGSKETIQLLKSYSGDIMYAQPWMFAAVPALFYIQNISGNLLGTSWKEASIMILSLYTVYIILAELIHGQAIDQYERAIYRIVQNIFVYFYPTFFTYFIFRIAALPDASLLIVLFFLLIFSNDVFAYVFGMLFGRRSKGFIPVSPNKSLAGYAGGIISTLAISWLFFILFGSSLPFESPTSLLILTLMLSFTSHLGDLFESLLKRSAHIKDSGNLIPGRGGFLDSIDSIIFSAPFFYLYVIQFVYG